MLKMMPLTLILAMSGVRQPRYSKRDSTPKNGQLLLEATKPAHFINKGQISPQVLAQELSSLTTYARSMFCCLQHYDLDNSLGICYRRVSLAPAREFEVNANCVNFGVSSGDATEILSCVILVLPIDSGDHVDDGDTRWILVSLPNLRDLLLAQQSSKLRRDVVCGSLPFFVSQVGLQAHKDKRFLTHPALSRNARWLCQQSFWIDGQAQTEAFKPKRPAPSFSKWTKVLDSLF